MSTNDAVISEASGPEPSPDAIRRAAIVSFGILDAPSLFSI